MDRDAAFSYRCAACNRCCRGKRIQLNPYEMARLARALEIPLDGFLRTCVEGEVYLRWNPDKSCIFLGPEGCRVHADRPLVCRLYPLGRIVNADGERFVEVTPHPETEGAYGKDGVIADYLNQQGAAPFIKAADAYYALYLRLSAAEQADDSQFVDMMDILDLEGFVAREAARRGETPPATLEGKVERHCEWLAEALSGAEERP